MGTLLKAINNRKYIYFLTLKLNFDSFYKNYKKKIEEEQKANETLDELDKLNIDIHKVDEEIAKNKKLRIRKEHAEKLEKQKLLDEQKELEKKLLEDSKKRGKNKKLADNSANNNKTSPGKSMDGKTPSRVATARMSSLNVQKDQHLSLSNQPGGKQSTGDVCQSDSVNSELVEDNKDVIKKSTVVHKKKGGAKHIKKEDTVVETLEYSSIPDEDLTEELRELKAKYYAYDCTFNHIKQLLVGWDRTILDGKKFEDEEATLQLEEEAKGSKRLSKKEREKQMLEKLEKERIEKEKADREKMEKVSEDDS